MPWLLARVTASTPAARRASKALSGARNVYCLGAGVPRRVTAVSRLTMARSASARTWPAEPQRCVSARAATPSKCTSPAKASVAVVRTVSREVPGSALRGEGCVGCEGWAADGEGAADGAAGAPRRAGGPCAAEAQAATDDTISDHHQPAHGELGVALSWSSDGVLCQIARAAASADHGSSPACGGRWFPAGLRRDRAGARPTLWGRAGNPVAGGRRQVAGASAHVAGVAEAVAAGLGPDAQAVGAAVDGDLFRSLPVVVSRT